MNNFDKQLKKLLLTSIPPKWHIAEDEFGNERKVDGMKKIRDDLEKDLKQLINTEMPEKKKLVIHKEGEANYMYGRGYNTALNSVRQKLNIKGE